MRVRIIIIFLVAYASLGFSANKAVWNRSSQGIYENDIRSIFIDPENDNNIYVGTSKALYKSLNKGKSYQAILWPAGEQKGVNDIYISTVHPKTIYAATDAGLYESQSEGKTWDRIYFSSDKKSRQSLSVIQDDLTIYLGTQKGLYYKTDQETNWHKIKEGFKNDPVYQIIQDQDFLYVATGQALFKFNKQTKRMQKIFSMGIGERRNENNTLDQTAARKDQFIKFITISKLPQSHLIVASSNGIYFSDSHGKEWKQLSINNLAIEDLTSLLILENTVKDEKNCYEAPFKCLRLLAGTTKGVFFLKNEKWIPLYKGMETNDVSYLANDKRRTVYAATTKGIYFFPTEEALPSSPTSPEPQTDLRSRHGFHNEPSISEVHQLAINYAEVNREKIANWRVLARKKALLPDLSVGLDRNASDLFHWNTGASPDELQKGRDYIDWDVGLSWDLSDFVWSTDQTTIDSRSKLMVELREDILNEVTRLYFERRRLQTELISDDLLNPPFKMDKELRIAELTALIDALTGGEFSKKIH